MAEKCIGCGYCCVELTCALSIKAHGNKICSALDWNGQRHLCSLVNEPDCTAAAAVGIGKGCGSSSNPWRNEPLRDRKQTRPAG